MLDALGRSPALSAQLFGAVLAAGVLGCGEGSSESRVPDASSSHSILDAANIDAVGIDASVACPDPDPPMAAKLTCHMTRYLIEAGFAANQIVEDGAVLREPGAEAKLIEQGFTVGTAGAYRAVYLLGENPTLHTDGQRIIYAVDETITFLTFASANGGFMQHIVIDPDGTVVTNTVRQLD